MKLVFHISENGSEIKRKINISGKNMITSKKNKYCKGIKNTEYCT
jgi:hypothetical protein